MFSLELQFPYWPFISFLISLINYLSHIRMINSRILFSFPSRWVSVYLWTYLKFETNAYRFHPASVLLLGIGWRGFLSILMCFTCKFYNLTENCLVNYFWLMDTVNSLLIFSPLSAYLFHLFLLHLLLGIC